MLQTGVRLKFDSPPFDLTWRPQSLQQHATGRVSVNEALIASAHLRMVGYNMRVG